MRHPKQQSMYLSVDQGNADHVVMKQHAALPSERIQLLFTYKWRDSLSSLCCIYANSSVCEYTSQSESLSKHNNCSSTSTVDCVMVCLCVKCCTSSSSLSV